MVDLSVGYSSSQNSQKAHLQPLLYRSESAQKKKKRPLCFLFLVSKNWDSLLNQRQAAAFVRLQLLFVSGNQWCKKTCHHFDWVSKDKREN